MPRRARMYLAGVPAHVVQRGNNRSVCFHAEADFRLYLDQLEYGLRRYRVALHAYVLMSNHVHLLMTPSDAEGISRVMQHVGRSYVLYVNKTYRRTGTLWEGRHKGSIVCAEEYLLRCYRYIERNPVVAGIAARPADYRWSSYGANGDGERNFLLTPHPLFLAMGITAGERMDAYRALFEGADFESSDATIRTALRFNYALGNEGFRSQVERLLGRPLGAPRPGRPARGGRRRAGGAMPEIHSDPVSEAENHSDPVSGRGSE
ncbi:MAG: transposase [Gammaproteobacteria bacterium]